DFQIVLSNFNARWFVKYYGELEPLLTQYQHKITFIQIPIQSGSSRILKLMDRHYTIEDVEAKLLRLRQKAPALPFTTDIIAGFPGETLEDFELTKAFLSRIRFRHVDIFAYEKRPGTKAGTLPGDIAPDVINERVLQLARLQNSL
ncbi:MAG: radical SAM protein, partial [Candidatus Omnitrophota bacterium]